jgi:hypothetical protein
VAGAPYIAMAVNTLWHVEIGGVLLEDDLVAPVSET